MSRLCIFATIFVASLATIAYGHISLDNYIESRQKLIDEENDKFLGVHSVNFAFLSIIKFIFETCQTLDIHKCVWFGG